MTSTTATTPDEWCNMTVVAGCAGVGQRRRGNLLSSPNSGQELRVCGDYRPFLRRYKVVDGDSTIAPDEFPKSLCNYREEFLR